VNPHTNCNIAKPINAIGVGVKITVKNYQKKIPIYPARIKKVILKILRRFAPQDDGPPNILAHQITVCFVSDKKIKELNLKYCGKANPTDVLAFDLSSPAAQGRIFADIIISADTAIRNAGIFQTSPSYEIYLYVVHGILHLLGYDDHAIKQKQKMRKKEREILEWLSIKPKR